MSRLMTFDRLNRNDTQAEFDKIADLYQEQHKKNLHMSGEPPEYFSEYKISDLAKYIETKNLCSTHILDFGCGIGNSIEFFRKYFPNSKLYCADISERSIEIAKSRFPGNEIYLKINDSIPVPPESFDIIFTACVFHHIDFDSHKKWLSEIKRAIKKEGIFVIYEHNPLNPLTIYAVNTCPFDINAKLIKASTMKSTLINEGWTATEIEYKLFFPSFLKALRPLEKYLSRFFLGAQWRLISKANK